MLTLISFSSVMIIQVPGTIGTPKLFHMIHCGVAFFSTVEGDWLLSIRLTLKIARLPAKIVGIATLRKKTGNAIIILSIYKSNDKFGTKKREIIPTHIVNIYSQFSVMVLTTKNYGVDLQYDAENQYWSTQNRNTCCDWPIIDKYLPSAQHLPPQHSIVPYFGKYKIIED